MMGTLWASEGGVAATAAATAAGAARQQPTLLESMLPLLFIFVVIYFVAIRPQSRKAKAHAAMLKELKSGDEVISSGGIIARVKSVFAEYVILDIGGGSSLKIRKENVSALTKNKDVQKDGKTNK